MRWKVRGISGGVCRGAAWLAVLACCGLSGRADEPKEVPLLPEPLPPPRVAPPTPTPPAPRKEPASGETILQQAEASGIRGAMLISLPAALRLAQTTNLDIAQAREVVNQARATLMRAQVAILPNMNLGSTYTHHDGNIQKTEGNIEKVNRDSLFVGGGPSMSFSVADAIFLPLAARQALAATQAGFQRVNNDTLMAVADAYFQLMQARRRLERIRETLEFLLSSQPSPERAGARGMLPTILAFYEAGGPEALLSEVDRVRVEVLRRQEERAAAIQDFLLASANLARLIRLDPAIPMWPVEDFARPIPLPGGQLLDRPLDSLAAVALSNRPELAENRALIEATLARLRGAQYRPWLPNVVLNYNWGDFGGGPDTNPPIVRTSSTGAVTVTSQPGFGPSGRILHMNTRDDFDVTLVWRFQNMGLGNLADVREQQAIYRRLGLRQLQTQDLVVAQVVRAVEAIRGWRARMNVTAAALFDSQGRRDGPAFRSMRLTFDKIRGTPNPRVLEALDSLRSLNDLLEAYAQSMTLYERSQFRLLVVLGLPPQSWGDPRALAKLAHLPPPPDQAPPAAAPSPAAPPLPPPRPAPVPMPARQDVPPKG